MFALSIHERRGRAPNERAFLKHMSRIECVANQMAGNPLEGAHMPVASAASSGGDLCKLASVEQNLIAFILAIHEEK
jgi:hypothetical protein